MAETEQHGPADGAATSGKRLRLARESRGKSLEKAAEDLHLDTWVVEAMESGAYAKIGPPVYVKGYLKRYASIVGLPADEIIRDYESSQMVRPEVADPVPAARPAPPTVTSRLPWRELGAIAVLFSFVAMVFWWKPWASRSASNSRSAVPAVSAPTSGPPAEVAASANRANPTAPPTAPTGAAASNSPVTAQPLGTPSRLRLSFSADSWVEVRDANRRIVYIGLGKANSIKTLHARAPLSVYLGFANGVQLDINERAVPIEDRFVTGDSARFALEADGAAHRIAR